MISETIVSTSKNEGRETYITANAAALAIAAGKSIAVAKQNLMACAAMLQAEVDGESEDELFPMDELPPDEPDENDTS